MAEIDILIAFEPAAVIAQNPSPSMDPSNPTGPIAASISMVTPETYALVGNAGNKLDIRADTLDIIRWRVISLSLNAGYRVMLYNFVDSGGGLIQAPQPIVITITEPYPGAPPNPPIPPRTQRIQHSFWQTTVLQPGTDTCHFSLVVTARNGNVLGYFWWDSFITIAA